jgi:membrane protease YdiL (CAAX protease family)
MDSERLPQPQGSFCLDGNMMEEMRNQNMPGQISPARFFTLTFVLSWVIWVPLALSHFKIVCNIPEATSNLVRLLGVLMPAASALILTRNTGGRGAIRNLWARLFLWQENWKWWLAAVLGQPALLGLAAIIFNLLSNSKITPEPIVSTSAFIVNAIILLIATLGEEIGWRGVALPSLQQQNGALKSSMILGLLWAIWHLPFWLLLDSFDQFGVGYLFLNFLFVLPLSFYITWFFNRSKQSILLPVIFHFTFNTVNTVLLPVTINIGAFAIFIAFEWMIAVLLIPQLEPKRVMDSI